MTLDAKPDDRQLALAPLDKKVDHVRGSPGGRLIIEYGPRRLRPARPAGRAGRDQKPRRSLTMIAVIRPGVITLLMTRMLFTPLGTP
jgi:hypothetical protein